VSYLAVSRDAASSRGSRDRIKNIALRSI
jgi:hypothetical protein